MNKLFKNTLSALTGLIMAANLAVVPVFAEGEEPTSTSTITMYENYNHYTDKNNAGNGYNVNLNQNSWEVNANNRRYTYVNFSIPQMDTDKLVKAELKATLSKNSETRTLDFYAKHIPYSTWRTMLTAKMVRDKVFADAATSPTDGAYTNVTFTATETAMNGLATGTKIGSASLKDETTSAAISAGTTLTMDITDYIKLQIAAGVDDIDVYSASGTANIAFYSAKTADVTDAQKPQIVYTIDTTNLDSDLSALTADNFKKFINTYYNELGLDYKVVNRINTLSDAAAASVFNKIAAEDKTVDAFAEAVTAAFEGLSSSTVEVTASESVAFDGNQKLQVLKNQSTIRFVNVNTCAGAFSIELPDVAPERVKSVKLVANTTTATTATSADVMGFEDLDISSISTVNVSKSAANYTEEAVNIWNAGARALASTANVYANTTQTLTKGTAEKVEADITDYVLEALNNNKSKMSFMLYNSGWNTNVTINTSTSAAPKLVFELEYESVIDEFNAIDTAEELDAFMKDGAKAATLGIVSSDYTKFSYPIYLAEYIIEKGYNSVDEFKTVFAEAVAEYTEVVTVNKDKFVHYRANGSDSGVAEGLKVNATQLCPRLVNGYGFVLYNMPLVNNIMDGTMTAKRASTSTNVRSSTISGYTTTAPEAMPVDGVVGSDAANAWLAYADSGVFTNDSYNVSFPIDKVVTDSIVISDKMIEALNTSVKADGYFAIRFASGGDNIYYTDVELTLNTDKTEVLAMKDRVTEGILSKEDNVSLDEYLSNMTAAEASSVGLDLTDYKRFEYGYYVAEEALGASTIEDFKTKLAAGIEKYSTPLTLNAVNNVYYSTYTGTDTPMKTGFMAYNTSSSPVYGEVYFQYDLSGINAKIFSGTMYGNNVNVNSLVGTNYRILRLERFSIVSPELPAKRTGKEDVEFFNKDYVDLYEIGSAEAEAFNTWQTTDANFTTDGKTTFTFKPELGKVSDTLTISDDLISAINEATAENGSKELMIELEDGNNVYLSGITFDLLIDGTVAAYEKEQREEALMASIFDPITPEEMIELLESYDDILGLSENVAYQKVVDKTVVGQAVMDAAYEVAGIADVIEVINTTSEANPPAKLMEITGVDYINEPNYDLDPETDGLEGTGYLGSVSIKKYDDLSTTATLITAVYDKTTGALLGLKSVDATDAISKAGYGKTVKVNVGGYFVLGNDEEPTTEIKAFVWDSANGMKSLTDVYETDAVTTR